MSTSKKPASGAAAAAPAHLVPRSWLVTLTVLLSAPWLVVAAVYFGGSGEPARSTRTSASDGLLRQATPGPWGTLSIAPIVISPPVEYVPTDWGPPGTPQWFFPGLTSDEVESLLVTMGAGPQTAARVRSTLRSAPQVAGVVAAPGMDTLRGLTPEVRGRLYPLLAKVPLNFDQAHSFRFLGPSADAWLGNSLISPKTRQLVEALIYRDGPYVHFADFDLIREGVADAEELRRLAKTLLRQATVLARLSVPAADEVGTLAEYWGRGGRKTDLRPLLESVAGAGPDRSIDIVHLLPAFARNYLYRYPKLTAADYDKPVIANCLWSALNFFLPHPDDRFLDVGFALGTLKRDYYVIESGLELGDIIAFLDAEDDIFHVVVYIADGLVFTKNGTSPMSPWILLPLEQVKAYYRTRVEEPRLINHRRNDF